MQKSKLLRIILEQDQRIKELKIQSKIAYDRLKDYIDDDDTKQALLIDVTSLLYTMFQRKEKSYEDT